jgi:competence protein ComEC
MRLLKFDAPLHGIWEGPPFGLQVKSSAQLAGEARGILSTIVYAPLRLNERLYDRVEPFLRGRATLGACTRALFFARTDAQDEEFYETFKLGGVLHILAISGLHVGIYLGYLLILLRMLRVPPRAMAWTAVAFLLFYASFCGFRAPVLRASIMGILHFGGLLLHRPQDPLHTLGMSLPINALLMPHYAFTPGFILSYLASFAIFLFMKTRIPAVLSLAYASVPTQLLLLPFLLYAFGTFTWGAVALNPVVIPLASVMLFFLPFMVLAPCPLYAAIGDTLSRLALGAVTVFDRTFWWGAYQPYPKGVWVLAFYAFSILFLLRFRHSPARLWKGLTAGLAVFLACYYLCSPVPRTRTTFLDVGQGSSTLVEDAGNAVLIDTGRASWSGRLLPQLLNHGVVELRALLLTHPDADHGRWAGRILKEFPVGCLMVPGVFEHDFHLVIRTAREGHIPVVLLHRGQRIAFEGVTFKVLHPGRAPCASQNACSLVLLEEMRGRRILLTGDAETATEAALVPDLELPLHILQAAHHGSRTGTSERLLACARPRLTVISVGRTNPYGHPHPETLERLASAGNLVRRTDRRGPCVFEWNESLVLW